MWYKSSSWLAISVDIMILMSPTPCCCKLKVPFFCWKVLHCVYVLYFLYPCITRWTLRKFLFCATVNSATVNMEIHIFDILISFGYISHGGTLPDNMRISIFNSLFWHYCFVIWVLCKCEHMLQFKVRKTMGLVCITSYYSRHVLQPFSL